MTAEQIKAIKRLAARKIGEMKANWGVMLSNRINTIRFEEQIKTDPDCAKWSSAKQEFWTAAHRLYLRIAAHPRAVAIEQLGLEETGVVPTLKLVCFVSALKESAVKVEPKVSFDNTSATSPVDLPAALDRMATNSGTDGKPSELALFMASRLWAFSWIAVNKSEALHNRVAGYFQAVIDAMKRRARALSDKTTCPCATAPTSCRRSRTKCRLCRVICP